MQTGRCCFLFQAVGRCAQGRNREAVRWQDPRRISCSPGTSGTADGLKLVGGFGQMLTPLYREREQTEVKHRCLERYLQAAARILGSWSAFVYVDCCAGPWR